MKTKVLLYSLNSRFTQMNLALHCLYSHVCPKLFDSFEFEIFEESVNRNSEELLDSLMEKDFEILAISCYIWNISAITSLLLSLRQIRDCVVILGGHEVSHDPGTWLEKGVADYVISAEGEDRFLHLLTALKRKTEICMDGISYRKKNQLVISKAISFLDTQSISSVIRNSPGILEHDFIHFESSRGCPYQCHFCLSGLEKKIRFFNLESVFADLEMILQNEKVRQVKFVDRTFNTEPRRAREIFRFLLDKKTQKNFHFEIAAERLDEETIDLLSFAKAGTFQFEIGVQTIQEEVLAQNGRRCDMKKLERNIRFLLQKTKVHIHLDLVAGLAGQSPEDFKKSFDFVHQLWPHHFQIEVLKVLKGSVSRKRSAEQGYHFDPNPPYILLSSSLWGFLQLKEVREISLLMDTFYNRACFRKILFHVLCNQESPFEFWKNCNKKFKETFSSYHSFSLAQAFLFLYTLMMNSQESEDLYLCALFDFAWILQFQNTRMPWAKKSKTVAFAGVNKKNFPGFNGRGFIEFFSHEIEYDGKVSHSFLFGSQASPFCAPFQEFIGEFGKETGVEL